VMGRGHGADVSKVHALLDLISDESLRHGSLLPLLARPARTPSSASKVQAQLLDAIILIRMGRNGNGRSLT